MLSDARYGAAGGKVYVAGVRGSFCDIPLWRRRFGRNYAGWESPRWLYFTRSFPSGSLARSQICSADLLRPSHCEPRADVVAGDPVPAAVRLGSVSLQDCRAMQGSPHFRVASSGPTAAGGNGSVQVTEAV